MSYVEMARRLRPIIVDASKSLSDDEAYNAPELFSKWISKGHVYAKYDRVQFENKLYKCLQAHTSQEDWTPSIAVSLWVEVSNPAIEWPEWRQPTGAHDAYARGDKVSHNSKHWISDLDANVWEPGVDGWSEA